MAISRPSRRTGIACGSRSAPVRVTNGGKHSSGKINKALVLEAAGDDLQIVAVTERKAGEECRSLIGNPGN